MKATWIPIIKHLETLGVTSYHIQPANGCTMVSYGRVVAYYYVVDDTVTEIVYD